MTKRSDYTDEEWATLRRAPMVAGLAISLADPGGPIEAAKESMATLKAAAFRSWLMAAAKDAADAAKEGGFLGFGAEQVSKGEHAMLEQVGKVLGVGPS